MLIIRKYKRLGWFDLLDKIEEELDKMPSKSIYLEFMDEFRMRLLESVSEGGSYKLKGPAKDLLSQFEARMSEDIDFATEVDLKEIREIANSVL